MPEQTILFLGAGATASVRIGPVERAPTTGGILPRIYRNRSASSYDPKGRIDQLAAFLQEEFHVDPELPENQYPGLPLLMSLIDMALDRREAINANWDIGMLSELREAIELGIFDVLEDVLRKAPTNNHYQLLEKLFPPPATPRIITTNYDLVADSTLLYLSQARQAGGGVPDYHCEIANMLSLRPEQKFGSIFKLHGSLNWLYCRNCQRLLLGATESTKFLGIFREVAPPDLLSSFSPDGSVCEVCNSTMLPLLIAPSHLKDYRNPHLSQVWHQAQIALRRCARVVFVGYSLPDDDVEVIYLLKRGLAHLSPSQITVVQYCRENPAVLARDHEVGRRYRALFGDIDWHAGGLDEWIAKPTFGSS